MKKRKNYVNNVKKSNVDNSAAVFKANTWWLLSQWRVPWLPFYNNDADPSAAQEKIIATITITITVTITMKKKNGGGKQKKFFQKSV